MSVRVVTLASALAAGSRQVAELEHVPGESIRQLAARARRPGWGPRTKLAVSHLGRRLEEPELDLELEDGGELVIVPDPEGLELLLYVGVSLLISAAAAFISHKLAPRPNINPQARDDETSQTYQLNIATEFRAGLPIPIILGEHDVGGTAIYAAVTAWGAETEILQLALLLGEGEIEGIGGITSDQDALGGFSDLPAGGAIPQNLRINGTLLDHTATRPGAYVFTRMGRDSQDPLPAKVGDVDAFPGSRTTLLVDERLDVEGAEAIFTITNTGALPIESIDVVGYFPAGLYRLGADNKPKFYTVTCALTWRPVGTSAWRGGAVVDFVGPTSSRQPIAITKGFKIPGGTTSSIEVRMRRTTPQGGQDVVSQMIWRQVTYGLSHEFGYSGSAILGLVAEGSEKISGGQPNVVCRVKGIKVRVWDALLNGGQPSGRWLRNGRRTGTWLWELPASGEYAGIWSYPPGKNPAWLFAEVLTNKRWGLGRWVSDDMIDWAAIRNWADYCDRSVTVGAAAEAGHQCSFVVDAPMPAWELLVRICSAGRAVPFQRGNQVSVRYNYATAHGRGTNAIAAKSTTQLISDAQVADFEVTHRDPKARPGVLILQIRDELKDYAQRPIQVEDPAGGFNAPQEVDPLAFSKETIEFFGVTRETQARREALWMHRANRLIRREIRCRIGPEALASEVGDLIAVQAYALEPYDERSFAHRAPRDISGTSLRLDHDVTLDGSKTYQAVARDGDGNIVTVHVVASTSGTFTADSAIPITTSLNLPRGAPIIFGVASKITEAYEIRSISLNQDLTRTLEAHLWDASIHTDDDVGNVNELDWGSDSGATARASALESTLFVERSQTAAVPLTAKIRRALEGGHEIAFARAVEQGAQSARVYIRDSVATSPSSPAAVADFPTSGLAATQKHPWTLVGETRGRVVLADDLTPHELYDVAVVQQTRLGAWPRPEQGLVLQGLRAEEFPAARVAAPRKVQVTETFDGFLLSWAPLDFEGIDYVEVRECNASEDQQWLGAQVVGRTVGNRIEVPFPAGDAWSLRARARHGAWSPVVTVSHGWTKPENVVEYTGAVTPGWTLGGGATGSGAAGFSLGAGEFAGTATYPINIGSELEAIVVARLATWWTEAITIDDMGGLEIDGGELSYRLIDGREASVFKPGANFDLTIDDWAGTKIDDLSPVYNVSGFSGHAGEHARARLLVSYDSGAYEPFRPTRRTFTTIDFRVELRRWAERYAIQTSAVDVRIYVR